MTRTRPPFTTLRHHWFPKAILLKHHALAQSARMEAIHHATTHEDVFLCIPPLYHTGAKMHWFGSLFTGSKAVLLKGNSPRPSSGRLLRALLHRVAAGTLVPGHPGRPGPGDLKLEDYQLSQWRLMHIGAQPVPPSLIKHWMHYFPHHKYDTNYGLSESTGPGCVHLGMDHIDKVGSHRCTWIWLGGQDRGRAAPARSPGGVGELCVKGPGVMVCYYHNPEATAEVLKDGWLRTGDMARQDKDGFIFLVDRKKDVIISGGENLYPVQIEGLPRFPSKNP